MMHEIFIPCEKTKLSDVILNTTIISRLHYRTNFPLIFFFIKKKKNFFLGEFGKQFAKLNLEGFPLSEIHFRK